jgi:hypothetical protein
MDQTQLDETQVTETAPSEPAEPAAPVSRRDAILAAAEKVAQKPGEPTTETTDSGKPVVTDRARDAVGRFAVQEAATVRAPASVPADGVSSAPVAPKFPSSWKPEMQAYWQKLDPAVQAEINRRESDYMNGFQRLRPAAEFGEKMYQSVSPYMQTMQSLGIEPEVAVSELLKADHVLRNGSYEQKIAALQAIARDYGVMPQPEGAQVDPNVSRLEQQLRQIQNSLAANEQQRMAVEQDQLTRLVDQTYSAKDATGNPRFPFAEELMDQIVHEVRLLRQVSPDLSHADTLQQAYERAAWSSPGVRQKMLDAELAQRRAREAQEAKAALKKARSASVSVRGAPISNATSSLAGKSRREQIEAAMDSLR